MLVRTYGRRGRYGGAGGSGDDGDLSDLDSDSGGASADESDLSSSPLPLPPFSQSQGSSQGNPNFLSYLSAFSSQDSSPWSTDLDLLPSSSSKGKVETATLMEAQEFGEMMEHMDEVDFAIDGLRPNKPVRIRRASLLSLLSVCQTSRQRRLLRAHGLAKRIVDALLSLNFDDTPCTIAASALFFVLASDVQDDHLLDSPSCIRFLLKLLNPPKNTRTEGKTLSIGSKLLGLGKIQSKTQSFGGVSKAAGDSGSSEIVSKVEEILLSCKEIKSIKSTNGCERGTGRRPELSSKWIALLTMEKSCLSAVSFEDTSETVRRFRGNFKERLRELGGLDAIFDVLVSCHSSLERCMKGSVSLSVSDELLESVALILKCLKIMENATFLSPENQDHLLKMSRELGSKRSNLSFVGVVISTIQLLSDLSLMQSSPSALNCKETKSSQVPSKENWRESKGACSSSSDYAQCKDSKTVKISLSHKRKKTSPSLSEVSHVNCPSSISYNNGALGRSFGERFKNGSISKVKINKDSTKANNSSRSSSNRWISINALGLGKNSKVPPSKRPSVSESAKAFEFDEDDVEITGVSYERNSEDLCKKRPRVSENVKNDLSIDGFDPFEFDDDELEPSKWESAATRKETSSQKFERSMITSGGNWNDGYELAILSSDTNASSQSVDEENNALMSLSQSKVEEDSNNFEDCLLTSVKVLMNLTNDNPVGCREIATCCGLETMASLITKHFPLFDSILHSSSSQPKEIKKLKDHELDFLVAILGLLVNLVEKDSCNRSRLASTHVSVGQIGKSESRGIQREVIPLFCSIFLANQGSGEAAKEGKVIPIDDEEYFLEGEREAEKMIVEAYSALLLAFLSTESTEVRETIASYLPKNNLQALVPVLERFVAFHMTLNMISPDTHSAVMKVIESCKGP